MTTVKYAWLRWIGVLPIAIAAYLIAYNLLRLLSLLNVLFEGKSPDGWYNLYIIPIIAAGAAGYAFVSSGVFTAPYHKKHTGLVLLIVITLLIGGALFVVLSKARVMSIIEVVASLVGAVIGFFAIEEE